MAEASNGNGNGRVTAIVSIIVVVCMFVFGSFGTVGWLLISAVSMKADKNASTIEKSVDDMRNELHVLGEQMRSGYMPRAEQEVRFGNLTKEIAGLTQLARDLRADSVTLDAHQAVLDRVSRLEQTVGNITPVGDVIKDMQDQIKRLQAQYITERIQSRSTGDRSQ